MNLTFTINRWVFSSPLAFPSSSAFRETSHVVRCASSAYHGTGRWYKNLIDNRQVRILAVQQHSGPGSAFLDQDAKLDSSLLISDKNKVNIIGIIDFVSSSEINSIVERYFCGRQLTINGLQSITRLMIPLKVSPWHRLWICTEGIIYFKLFLPWSVSVSLSVQQFVHNIC